MGKFFLYPLNFTEQEALAFSLLPSIVDQEKVPPGFKTAYDKVIGTHLKEKSRQNDLIADITDIIQMGTPAYRQESPNFLQPIIGAILSRLRSIRSIIPSTATRPRSARSIPIISFRGISAFISSATAIKAGRDPHLPHQPLSGRQAYRTIRSTRAALISRSI